MNECKNVRMSEYMYICMYVCMYAADVGIYICYPPLMYLPFWLSFL